MTSVGVVGAGIVGTCAAWRLAAAGARVTVFERFALDHDRGSSYGDSRIVRRFYDDPRYTRLMTHAYPLWRELERESGRELLLTAGGLYIAPQDHPRLAAALDGMRAVGVRTSVLEGAQLRRRFPQFVFAEDEAGMIDADAGILLASACVKAAAAAAQARGVTFEFGRPLQGLDDAALRGFDAVVVCAGPWSAKLFQAYGMPLSPTKQQYVVLAPARDAAAFALGSFPVWIDAATSWYGFPMHGNVRGAKIACHAFGPTIDPDDPSREPDPAVTGEIRAYARRRLPALAEGEAIYTKVCLYTVTPDEDFIVDALPDRPGWFAIAGLSGHGFKFGPLLGSIAADLALRRPIAVDISGFSLRRFG